MLKKARRLQQPLVSIRDPYIKSLLNCCGVASLFFLLARNAEDGDVCVIQCARNFGANPKILFTL